MEVHAQLAAIQPQGEFQLVNLFAWLTRLEWNGSLVSMSNVNFKICAKSPFPNLDVLEEGASSTTASGLFGNPPHAERDLGVIIISGTPLLLLRM